MRSDAEREYYRAYKRRRKKLGMCPRCGKKSKLRVSCATCLRKGNASKAKHRRKRKLRGQCLRCQSPAEKGHTTCSKHLELRREYDSAKRLQWKREGKCTKCGGNIDETEEGGERMLCVKCLAAKVLLERKRFLADDTNPHGNADHPWRK